MKKILLNILKGVLILYILICALMYFFQEKMIFAPSKLNADYKFSFKEQFQELNIKTKDNKTLSGLLFKADSCQGLIFYLHGNGGALDTWGDISKVYTDLHYDLFMLDYRGYGKSSGEISGQEQIFSDIQIAYDSLRFRYDEKKIIILGYSIGTGLATKLASINHPKKLILQAPYYSLVDIMQNNYAIIPTFLLKYKFETNKYIKECKMPIVIFHGDADEAIPYSSSLKLKKLLKQGDKLITLKGQGHNGMSDNSDYLRELKLVLK